VTFTGFPDDAFALYEGLEADNSKTYWIRHKATYDTCVRTPMVELLALLEPEFGPGNTFRPYRDVRFSKQVALQDPPGRLRRDRPGGRLLPAARRRGAGFHSHASDQVERYRAAVADERSGEQLREIVGRLSDDGFDITGDRLKTKPRGYPDDHPRIELLRYKSLTATQRWPMQPWMHEPALADRVRHAWRALGPLVEWVDKHVGPSHAAR